MRYLLIRNAKLVGDGVEAPSQTVLVANDRVVGIGDNVHPPLTNTTDLDAQGKYIIPSLIGLCYPVPNKFDNDTLGDLNFYTLTAGQTTLMTVAAEVEEHIGDLQKAKTGTINYGIHFPLRELTQTDIKRFRRLMLTQGIATACLRLGDERNMDTHTLTTHIAAARALGLRVLYDMRGLVDGKTRKDKLAEICNVISQDHGNKAYVGIEHEEELAILMSLRSECDVNAQLCYDPFGQSTSGLTKLNPQTIADTLRQGQWCSLGLVYSDSRASREGWPDMTPEIVSRNLLPLLNAMPSAPQLTLSELIEFVIERPATTVGLMPNTGRIALGSSAAMIIWDNDFEEYADIDTPRGNIQKLHLRGRIEKVIMNGNVVVDDKYRPEAIDGKHIYSRL